MRRYSGLMEDPFDLLIRLNLPLAHAVIATFAEMRLYVLCAQY